MERYKDNVRPDEVYPVPITGGELRLSPGHDILHYFPWLDQWILKYWDSDHEPPRMCNVILGQDSAEWLVQNLDLEVCSRTFITENELEHVREWGAAILDTVFGDELKDIDDGTLD